MLEQYQNFLRNNLYLLTIKQMTVFNQKEYLITEMDNWVINFIPVIKEVQKEVVKEDNEYFYITSNGKYIFPSANKWDHDYVARKQYGNYYPSRKAAEAVYNLRIEIILKDRFPDQIEFDWTGVAILTREEDLPF